MKRILLSMFMALIAIFATNAKDKWPITLTKADGLPGKKVSMYMSYSSRLFDLEEPTNVLRITMCETSSTSSATNSTAGRITTGPGYAYVTLTEIRVLDAEGNHIKYTITTNAQATGAGVVEALADGDTLTYFQSTTSKGTYGGNYHHVELTFEKPISKFSVEWDSHPQMHSTIPTYAGLTPGTDYVPYPEQKLSFEKVTNIDELSKKGGLFLLEGHAPQWYNSSLDQTYAGGGFFEGPQLATSHPSPVGLFSLIPVKGKKDTYKVAYINHDHYIASISKANSLNTTNLESSAAEIKFTMTSDGNFKLTASEDAFLVVEDAYMRLQALVNTDEGKAASKRPFSEIFTLHKATISGASLAWRLQEIVDESKSRISHYHSLIGESEENAENDLRDAIESAEECIADEELTYSQLLASEEEMNEALFEYVSSYLYYHMDSLIEICEQLENNELPTSEAPNWKKDTYPANITSRIERMAADISEQAENSNDIATLDECIEMLQYTITSFWAARVKHINTLPFQVGISSDELPGTQQAFGGYKWESPLYYFNEPVNELRFTVLKTNGGFNYLGYDVPAIAEFEIYDKLGEKINITEDMITLNSLTTYGGSSIKKLIDGLTNTYYMGVPSADKVDVNGYAENPDYCYIDIKLPEAMDAFRYVQQGYTVGTSTPINFVFGKYGERVTPETCKYADANNAVCGEKITDVAQITNDGIYAIYGLMNCDPTNGNNEKGAFYTSDTKSSAIMHSQCAFYIKSNGDGTYCIQSLNDGKYWPASATGEAVATSYLSKAAKVKIAPRGNDGLPNSFMIYQDKKDADSPYGVFQDWGESLGCMEVASFDECENDGQSEWYIYRVTMENPEHYALTRLINCVNDMNMAPSNDPGRYNGTESLMQQIAEAQKVADTYDYDACAAATEKLSAAIEATAALKPNPVIEGVYVIESAYHKFEVLQSTKMAMRSAKNNDNSLGGNFRYKWEVSPMGQETMDSTYCFEFISAASSDAVEDWVSLGTITAEEAKSTFYIRNVATKEFIGTSSSILVPITSGTSPVPYVIRSHSNGEFDFWNPADPNNVLFANNTYDGKQTKGDITYSYYTEPYSCWNLRLLRAGLTSISAPVVEGEEVVSTSYYTADGIASSAPVKGLNIVKYTYSNGVVKSRKIFIK